MEPESYEHEAPEEESLTDSPAEKKRLLSERLVLKEKYPNSFPHRHLLWAMTMMPKPIQDSWSLSNAFAYFRLRKKQYFLWLIENRFEPSWIDVYSEGFNRWWDGLTKLELMEFPLETRRWVINCIRLVSNT